MRTATWPGSGPINYRNPGSEDSAPFAWQAAEDRDGGEPETIKGRRWYDGQVQYWVKDYTHNLTDSFADSGARVDLAIGEQTWSFTVAETAFDDATSDSSGWWHVFDIQIDGSEVTVETVDRFEPDAAGILSRHRILSRSDPTLTLAAYPMVSSGWTRGHARREQGWILGFAPLPHRPVASPGPARGGFPWSSAESA